MYDAEVLAGIGTRSADTIGVGLFQRSIEAGLDLLEPVAGLLQLPGEEDLLLGGQRRQLGDGEFGERLVGKAGRQEGEVGHDRRPHANARSPVPRRSAWRS